MRWSSTFPILLNIVNKSRAISSSTSNSISRRLFSSVHNGANTTSSSATTIPEPNLLTRAIIRYYSPFAMKVTAFVFGMGGVVIGEEIQKYNVAENNVSWKDRLTTDSVTGLVFAFSGYYLHMFLPSLMIIFPLFALIPDESDKVMNNKSDDIPNDETKT